jgi:predicted SAM-dependent methyltransferase
VGCGQVRFPGWVNIDADAGTKADVVWDIRHGLLAPDASCRCIYNEHVLEHLAVEDGLSFLRECCRALAPGGVLRVAMPSLDVIIEKSANGTWRDQDWLSWPGYESVATRAEMLNLSFRNWGHQWLYDREELHRRLAEAGFVDICDVKWGTSCVPELCNRETRKDSLLICEARR